MTKPNSLRCRGSYHETDILPRGLQLVDRINCRAKRKGRGEFAPRLANLLSALQATTRSRNRMDANLCPRCASTCSRWHVSCLAVVESDWVTGKAWIASN